MKTATRKQTRPQNKEIRNIDKTDQSKYRLKMRV